MQLEVVFDLDFSLCCGQVFRWRRIAGWWYGVVGDKVIKIRQCGSELEFWGASDRFVRQYFRLNDNLTEINKCIAKDSYIQAALKRFEGLRIVRQVPWECLASFICATYKSIAAIELMLRKISEKYGEKRVIDGLDFYTFPSAQKLAGASENGLRECGLGYRAKYLQATARKIVDDKIDLEALKALPYLDARKKLFEFSGVGLKVADCVLLFSLEKPEAFPVDVWVKRVILNHYADQLPAELVTKMKSHDSLTNGEYQKIGGFARIYFGRYAGYAQEYLYHYERTQH
ncbi:MAG: 8-oxoguanine DNA glycosylase [Candidatus Bathyarchaeota archaeon]|nr:8-oxoguanine DNA glycosylase [Candidatus Bathyarchaeota archaeon]